MGVTRLHALIVYFVIMTIIKVRKLENNDCVFIFKLPGKYVIE